jgi:WD40 repeat protein
MTKNSIYDLLFTSGGKVVTIEDKYIYIRDIQTKKETEIALKNYCVSCSLSKDGKYLLYSDAMHNSYLWELGEEDKLLATNGATGVPYNICSISENGKYYANTFGQCKIDNGTVSSDIMEIWNTKELKYAMEPVVMEDNIVAMEFSPCGNYICTIEADNNELGTQKVSYFKIGEPKPLFENVVMYSPLFFVIYPPSTNFPHIIPPVGNPARSPITNADISAPHFGYATINLSIIPISQTS